MSFGGDQAGDAEDVTPGCWANAATDTKIMAAAQITLLMDFLLLPDDLWGPKRFWIEPIAKLGIMVGGDPWTRPLSELC